jgi:formamidopyrimidine-DNA glycosylase
LPELPEVESYRRYFERHALRRRVREVTVADPGVLAPGTSPASLRRALVGRRFSSIRRHGKNLFAQISRNGFLRIHFGMTGDLASFRDGAEAPRFARVLFHFEDGSSLAYQDARKFGRIELIGEADEYLQGRRFGPDPVSPQFRVRDFVRSLERRRGAIKPLLMNQRVIAGVGNLYADEALFQSGIHPSTRVETLSFAALIRLFRTLKKVLKKVTEIQHGDRPYPRSYLLPSRAEGERCPRCRGRIARTTVGGRTTYYCARHQAPPLHSRPIG